MNYQYKCPNCNSEQEILKPVKDIDRVEPCNICDTPMRRIICPVVNHKSGDGWADK